MSYDLWIAGKSFNYTSNVMIDYSSAQRPVFGVPTTTEWLRQKGLGRDGKPLEEQDRKDIAA